MKKSRFIYGVLALIATIFLSSCASITVSAGSYSRKQARETISQTSYIINRAYDIAHHYSYWQGNKLSTAMYYNDYAQRLYFYHNYRSAIRYSLLAREYALDLIDGCDAYWEYFYYTYFGWSATYGYNYNFGYANGYRDGYYDGYYAGYCARHRHDYRNDPYRNMQSHWYNNDNYYRVMNNSTASNDRNNSHAIGNSATGNRPGYTGEPTRPTYRNINTDDYYSNSEINLSRDLPNRETMATEFKRENPNITISDENVKNDPNIIKRNAQASSDFANKKTNSTIVNGSQIKKPTEVKVVNPPTMERPNNPTINNNNTNGKPSGNLKPTNNKNNKPSVKPNNTKPERTVSAKPSIKNERTTNSSNNSKKETTTERTTKTQSSSTSNTNIQRR